MKHRAGIVILALSGVVTAALGCCYVPFAVPVAGMDHTAMTMPETSSEHCDTTFPDSEDGDAPLLPCCEKNADPMLIEAIPQLASTGLAFLPVADAAPPLASPDFPAVAHSPVLERPPGVHDLFEDTSILRV